MFEGKGDSAAVRRGQTTPFPLKKLGRRRTTTLPGFGIVILPILAVCLFVLPSIGRAQGQPENRFLFVINTSSAMRRMTNGISEAVLGLIRSGMQGQMRDGDTFGIWTYDEKLHSDFPMKVWTHEDTDALAANAAAFLAGTHFEKRARLENVLAQVRQVIGNSRVLTVIFIFDGTEAMQGTGFDKDINDLHKEFGRQVRADNIPFVTVLVAHDGKVFDYRVRTPSSISLPDTAGFFKAAETNAAPPIVAAKPATPPAAITPKPLEPRRPEIVLKPTEVPKTNSAAAVVPAPETPAAEKSPPVPTVAVPAPAPAPTVQNVPVSTPAAPAESQTPTSAAVVAPVLNAKPSPPVVAATPAPALRESAETRITETPKAAAPVVPAVPVAKAPPPPAVLEAAPTTAVIKDGGVLPNAATGAERIIGTNGPGPAARPQPIPAALPVATALPPSPTDHLMLLVIAFSLVTIAAVLVFFLFRRQRTPPSLISQSMDRPR